MERRGSSPRDGDGRPVVVIGAGGHSLVCVEVLQDCGWNVIGCVTDDGRAGAALSVPLIGSTAQLAGLRAEHDALHGMVAIGDNRARRALGEQLEQLSIPLATAVSPIAHVSSSAVVGAGSLVMPGAVVNAQATLGRLVIVNTRASVDHESTVGDAVHLAPAVAIAGRVTIQQGVFLGIGTVVIPGCIVGEWAFAAAGSVIVRDVAAGDCVAGVPARSMLNVAPT